MRQAFIVVLTIAIAAIRGGASDRGVAFVHVNVVDVDEGSVRPDMSVVVKSQHIVRIGKSGHFKLPKNARIVDGTGKYLIPGLWDMHVHTIFGDWIPKNEKVTLALFVANGITGVRDMGGDLDSLAHRDR